VSKFARGKVASVSSAVVEQPAYLCMVRETLWTELLVFEDRWPGGTQCGCEVHFSIFYTE